MVTKARNRIDSDAALSPGLLLADELAARSLTQRDLAERMQRPPQVISEIVRGKKAITADTALQLERVLGTPAYLWLALESDYQLALARLRLAAAKPPSARKRRSA